MGVEIIDSATLDPRGTAEKFEEAVKVIYSAIAQLNPQLQKERQLQPSLNTALFGSEGKLDSLGVANLIVIVEQKLEEVYGFKVDLTQDDPFSLGNGHFRNISSLATYIFDLVQQHAKTGPQSADNQLISTSVQES
jgi:acyl carrier protein